MDMEQIAVFRMTTGKMQWLAERQRVLATLLERANGRPEAEALVRAHSDIFENTLSRPG